MILKKFGQVLTSKSVGTGPSCYEQRIYRATVSQSLRNTVIEEVEAVFSGKYSGVTQGSLWNPEYRA